MFAQFAELHLSTVVNFSSANLTNESVTDQSFLRSLEAYGANSGPDLERTPRDKEKCKMTKHVQNRPNMQVATFQFSTLPNRPAIVVSAPSGVYC